MEFRELDFFKELASVKDVRESGESVVKVLHLRSLEHEVTFTGNRLDVFIEFDHGHVLW